MRVLAAALAAGLLAGCAVAQAAPADPAAVEARADGLYTVIGGNAQQREAANYLQWIDMNQEFWSCMAAAGFEPRRHFSYLWRGWTANGTSGEWLGRLQNKPSATALAKRALAGAATSRPVPPSDPVAPQRTRPDYEAAAEGCETADQSVVLGSQPGVPDGSQRLLAEFNTMVSEVEAGLGPIGSYRSCMLAAGVDYTASAEDTDGWQALYLYLTWKMPKAPAPGKQASAKWQEYLALEAAALDADESCRGDQYRRGLALLDPRLTAFAEKHAAELDQLAKGWQATVAEARAAGLVD
jgi:hypothetical protein